MKTNQPQIAEVYRAYLVERQVEPGVGCPAPEDLVQFATQGANRKARARIMEHVSNCPDCALVLNLSFAFPERLTSSQGRPRHFSAVPKMRYWERGSASDLFRAEGPPSRY